MRRRLSIRSRLTLWHIGLLALTLIGFSTALYVALSDQLYRSLDQRLELASLAALGTVRREDDESDDETPTFRYTPPEDLSARLLGPDGRILQAIGLLSTAPVEPAILERARAADGLFYTIDRAGVPRARAYVRPRLHDERVEAYVEVAEPLTLTESALSGLVLIVLIAVPITLAAAGFGGWFIADRALRPIDTITRQAQRISEQDLHRRLELDLPDDEVGRLAHTFDAMLARLDEAFQRQRQFTADASHELRTPLTVMKTNLGVTLNRPRSAKQYETALTQIESEVDRLTRLTNDLLLLARSDPGQPRPTLALAGSARVDLAALLGDVVTELRPLAEAKALTLTCAAEATATVHGDVDQLQRVFFNLIENAIKYTLEGTITARVHLQPDRVRVAIEDTGPGIAPEHLPHVFERFYRVDAARSREQGGSGLGLAIAHSLITAHHGTLEVSSELGRGTTFTITLPLA